MIEKMIELLTPPAAWTQGSFGRTKTGRTIGSTLNNAVCFCMAGAGMRVDPFGDEPWVPIVERAIREEFPERAMRGSIPVFNDHPDTTHADVLRVLHRARDLELAASPHALAARVVALPADTPIPPQALAALTAE